VVDKKPPVAIDQPPTSVYHVSAVNRLTLSSAPMVQFSASMGQNSSLPKPGRRKSLRSFPRKSHTNANLSHTFTLNDNEEKIELLNINQASEEELMTLPSVNREIAKNRQVQESGGPGPGQGDRGRQVGEVEAGNLRDDQAEPELHLLEGPEL
jgi:hypothetical protein